MFGWFKGRTETPPPPAPREEVEEEPALEALAAVLRTLGTSAPGVEDPSPEWASKMANGWADHLLLLRPTPDSDGSTPPPHRDYGGVRRFVLTWRRKEVAAVDQALDGLRQAVWAMVRAFNQAVGEDAREDVALDEHLTRLRLAAELDDPQAMRAVIRESSQRIARTIGERRKAQAAMQAELGNKIKTLADALHEARREGMTDPLTRLANRRALDARLAQAAELSGVIEGRICLVMVDIDHFKKVNDRHGHPAGDLVLKGIADLMSRTFLRKTDFCARYGGEELAAVLHDTSLQDARAPVERLLCAVRDHAFTLGKEEVEVTISIGVAALGSGESVAEWVRRADEALYAAKNSGRDRAVYADAASGQRSLPFEAWFDAGEGG